MYRKFPLRSGDRDALLKETEAKDAGRGLHAGNADAHVRSINWQPDARTLFDAFKGKAVPGTVSAQAMLTPFQPGRAIRPSN